MATTSAALTMQLAEAINARKDAERALATLRATIEARGDGVWDDDKVAAEIERHVAAIVSDHRRIAGELKRLQPSSSSPSSVRCDVCAQPADKFVLIERTLVVDGYFRRPLRTCNACAGNVTEPK